MQIETASGLDAVSSAITRTVGNSESAVAAGKYVIECRDSSGNLKWTLEPENLVVNQGLQYMNTQFFSGSGYSATWYIGLYGSASTNNPVAGDTAASHSFTEITPYSNATRPAATFGTASTASPSVISNSASPASFNINTTATVGGAFLISNSTKGGSTGYLFSASDFTSPGDRTVASGDVLNVTYTFSLSA